eukprot:SAG31_NODE_1439_length_8332_cov_11.389166_1_plen_412_part_00
METMHNKVMHALSSHCPEEQHASSQGSEEQHASSQGSEEPRASSQGSPVQGDGREELKDHAVATLQAKSEISIRHRAQLKTNARVAVGTNSARVPNPPKLARPSPRRRRRQQAIAKDQMLQMEIQISTKMARKSANQLAVAEVQRQREEAHRSQLARTQQYSERQLAARAERQKTAAERCRLREESQREQIRQRKHLEREEAVMAEQVHKAKIEQERRKYRDEEKKRDERRRKQLKAAQETLRRQEMARQTKEKAARRRREEQRHRKEAKRQENERMVVEEWRIYQRKNLFAARGVPKQPSSDADHVKQKSDAAASHESEVNFDNAASAPRTSDAVSANAKMGSARRARHMAVLEARRMEEQASLKLEQNGLTHHYVLQIRKPLSDRSDYRHVSAMNMSNPYAAQLSKSIK